MPCLTTPPTIIMTLNLAYLPLSGVYSLALSLAYILKLAASNYWGWGDDASSISHGPATTVRDYIPIAYGECIWTLVSSISLPTLIAFSPSSKTSTLLASQWLISSCIKYLVMAASMIMYYIFLFHQSAVAFSEFNKAKMQGKQKMDDNNGSNASSLVAIKYGSGNANVLAANRL